MAVVDDAHGITGYQTEIVARTRYGAVGYGEVADAGVGVDGAEEALEVIAEGIHLKVGNGVSVAVEDAVEGRLLAAYGQESADAAHVQVVHELEIAVGERVLLRGF